MLSSIPRIFNFLTLGKYVAYLKSIKCPRVNNFELLDGVDRVSLTIAGCIEFAESALWQSTTYQTPEDPNPRRVWTGDIFSGVDQVNSSLADCVKMTKYTLQAGDYEKQKDTKVEAHCKPEKADPWLDQMGKPISRTDRASSSEYFGNKTPEPICQFSNPLFDQDFDEFMGSLDNLEPFDDLEDWSDNVDLFMEAMCHPPHMADVLW